MPSDWRGPELELTISWVPLGRNEKSRIAVSPLSNGTRSRAPSPPRCNDNGRQSECCPSDTEYRENSKTVHGLGLLTVRRSRSAKLQCHHNAILKSAHPDLTVGLPTGLCSFVESNSHCGARIVRPEERKNLTFLLLSVPGEAEPNLPERSGGI